MNRPGIAVVNERREFTFADITNEAFRIYVQNWPNSRNFWGADYQVADPPRDRAP
jgi:hypothetical protein